MGKHSSFSFSVILKILFCIFSIIISLGLFNSSWFSLIIFSLILMLLYSGELIINLKNLILVVLICCISLFLRNNITVPDISLGSNVFIGGKSYENSIFKKKLPNKVYKKLNEDFISEFPNSVSGPDKNLYDKSVKQIFFSHKETKSVKFINWNNRYEFSLGAFNDANYNAYGNQSPNRSKLPFFVKYTFPVEYSDTSSKFCWKGLAFVEKKEIHEILHQNVKCIFIKENLKKSENRFIIWLVETGKTPELQASLILTNSYKIKFIFLELIKILSCLTIAFLIFKRIEIRKASFFLFCFTFSSFLVYLYYPNIINKFVLFEGGNDGLLYVHFAHLISDYLSTGNFIEAFRGGESAYDLMPFYRYIWVINFILFEESPWILFFILTFIPISIFSILNKLFNKNWSIFILLCWFIIPMFEAFGFLHYYYVKLAIRGFAEPLSYLCFFCSIHLIFSIVEKKAKRSKSYSLEYLVIGFLLALSMGLRANILPACLIVLIYLIYKNFIYKNFNNIFNLAIGFSPILILPIHNYVFTNKFIPLTIAAYKDWNLGAKPSEYLELFLSFLSAKIDRELLDKILSHIGGEIKLYEFWYHLSIISCLYYLFKKNKPEKIKLLSYVALGMISLILFYHVGGRYSYLTWTLALFVLLYWIKDFILPLTSHIVRKNAT